MQDAAHRPAPGGPDDAQGAAGPSRPRDVPGRAARRHRRARSRRRPAPGPVWTRARRGRVARRREARVRGHDRPAGGPAPHHAPVATSTTHPFRAPCEQQAAQHVTGSVRPGRARSAVASARGARTAWRLTATRHAVEGGEEGIGPSRPARGRLHAGTRRRSLPRGRRAAGSPGHVPVGVSRARLEARQASTAPGTNASGPPDEVRPVARDDDLDRSLLGDQLRAEEQLGERRGAGPRRAPAEATIRSAAAESPSRRRGRPRRARATAATEPAAGVTPSWASRGRTSERCRVEPGRVQATVLLVAEQLEQLVGERHGLRVHVGSPVSSPRRVQQSTSHA